jgi:hypothetical protein
MKISCVFSAAGDQKGEYTEAPKPQRAKKKHSIVCCVSLHLRKRLTLPFLLDRLLDLLRRRCT